MYDHSLYLRTLSEFARTLLTSYDVDSALEDLTSRLVTVLGLDGSGVALALDGQLQFATAVPQRIVDLERVQHEHQAGPCVNAYRAGRILAVPDLAARADDWPDYCAVAERLHVRAVVGVPMQLTDRPVGAVNLYRDEVTDWREEDLAAAVVMADMATAYLVNASTLRQQEQLNEQLKGALESRVLIEQAKGVVANARSVKVEAAFGMIRSHARSHNVTVRAVADAIVNLGLLV